MRAFVERMKRALSNPLRRRMAVNSIKKDDLQIALAILAEKIRLGRQELRRGK